MPRFTIDIDNTFDKTLTNLVSDTSASTKAEVIRNAVAVYNYLKSVTPKDAQTGTQVVSIKNSDGTEKQVLIP
ncbi:MAG: hypothetical protein ACLP7O_12610 [Terracidiphilus sp.]